MFKYFINFINSVYNYVRVYTDRKYDLNVNVHHIIMHWVLKKIKNQNILSNMVYLCNECRGVNTIIMDYDLCINIIIEFTAQKTFEFRLFFIPLIYYMHLV